MDGEREPAFWVNKGHGGYDGPGRNPVERIRAYCFGERAGAESQCLTGYRTVPVYVTVKKVKKPRKLTELQRNAVADWLVRHGVNQIGDMGVGDIRSGKAGL